jgi:hypothetical protein
MSETKGLRIFLRQKQITDKEWLDLIEARRELIKPHLDSFTLPELGALECLRTELNFTHCLGNDLTITTGDESFSLKTQGIFRVQPWEAIERFPNSGYCPSPGGVKCPSGTMLVWGLTRSGLWILVTIGFRGEDGYKERGYERAITVKIVETDLPTIVATAKEKPQKMWEALGKAIRGFAKHRKAIYEEALDLAQMVENEELAFSLISNEA